ncbi:metal ABC transporter ATP-binding protein [Bacillus sp. FJAT-44742]|uniref:metal ABC transporter ATP-binding protein n=1 Tax=Bacillus sp. FJAT-44742 TaxID=2014005 RepID=UPI000C24BACC|nr:metal ABC transporter ATP-binding protein [Bacillus sp. FJAT-44742]
MSETVKVENISVYYDHHPAIQNISFSSEKGILTGVIGPNGAGKSTLMKALLGLEKTTGGNIEVLGEKVEKVRKKLAYVPQRSDIDWDFPVLVEDVVLMGRYAHLPWYKKIGKNEKKKAREALEKVGMESYSKRQIGELSGGQQQRVFIARALVQDAEIFFLDEPFVGIDVKSEEIIINLLRNLKGNGKTIFVIHHDLSKVESYFDNLLLINQKLIAYGPSQEVYDPERLSEAYKGSLHLFSDEKVMVVGN